MLRGVDRWSAGLNRAAKHRGELDALLAQAFFRSLSLGDVLHDGHDRAGAAVAVANDRGDRVHRNIMALLVAKTPLHREAFDLPRQKWLHRLGGCGLLIGVAQLADVAA